MIKNLYLLRHGQAEHGFSLDDFDRSLTPAGISQLTSLAMALKRQSFYPDHVYCSPARRTQQTVEILTEQIDYTLPVDFLKDIYEASVRTLFEIVTGTDESFDNILIVGHNPGLSYLYDYLTSSSFGDMTPGELVKIEFENQKWFEVTKGSGTKKTI